MSSYYANIRTSNTYGQFYNPDSWAPSSLLKDPLIVKNRKPVRPGRTYEDYGGFYGDPQLRPNIRNYLGGYWGKPSAVQEQKQSQSSARDWSREREVQRSYPGALAAGVPSIQDGFTAPPDARHPSYRDARSSRSKEQYTAFGSRDSNRPSIPKWDLQVDPWKSEYRRHYLPEHNSRLPELPTLDQMTARQGAGSGERTYADEYPRVPAHYLQ